MELHSTEKQEREVGNMSEVGGSASIFNVSIGPRKQKGFRLSNLFYNENLLLSQNSFQVL